MASIEFTPDAEILSGNLLKYEVSTRSFKEQDHHHHSNGPNR